MAVIALPIEHCTPTPNLLRGKSEHVHVHASNLLHHLLHSILIDYCNADTVVTLKCANTKHAELVRDALEREASTFAAISIERKGPFTSVVGKCEFRFVSPTPSYRAKLLHHDAT